MGQKKRYPSEVRERAVRMVLDQRGQHESPWAAISSIAPKIGCSPETLRKWVRREERDTGQRPGPASEEPARLKVLEREDRELRQANEILRKASAFFAHEAASTPPVRVRPPKSSTARSRNDCLH